MKLPTVPPVVLVEPSALESAEVREGRHTALETDKAASVCCPTPPASLPLGPFQERLSSQRQTVIPSRQNERRCRRVSVPGSDRDGLIARRALPGDRC